MNLLNNKLEIIQGDITNIKVDAIVNAANSSLLGGGGVDGAIHSKGGSSILEACKSIRNDVYPEGLPTGKAVLTGAGNLPAKYVIHTVGPVWHGGNDDEEKLLEASYLNCLELAVNNSIKTIAFPAISTGIYGFPRKLAAKIVFKTISDFLANNSQIEIIKLVFFSESDMNVFLDSYKQE